MKNGMNAFLSEGAQREHKEYLAQLKYKASIYKKSGIDIKNEAEMRKSRVAYKEREEMKKLADEIKMHEIYFESFGNSFIPCPKIKEHFGSENNFAYLFSRFAERCSSDFLCLYSKGERIIDFCTLEDLPRGACVHLAMDLAEHAYFRDYGFKRDAYIRAALAHFDFSKINSVFASQINKV